MNIKQKGKTNDELIYDFMCLNMPWSTDCLNKEEGRGGFKMCSGQVFKPGIH